MKSVRPLLRFALCMIGFSLTASVVAQPTSPTLPQWLLPEETYSLEIRPHRLQVVDTNQDDYPDIIAISREAAEIWQNDGQGGLEKVATFEGPESSLSLEIGDWDGDGTVDFLSVGPRPRLADNGTVPPQGTPLTVWLNRGNDGFVRGAQFFLGGPDVKHDILRVLPGDLNGDGLADLLVEGTVLRANFRQPSPRSIRPAASASVFISRGDGSFESETSVYENSEDANSSFKLGDLDGDGDLDFVRTVGFATGRETWLNSGEGRFEMVEELAPLPDGIEELATYLNDRRLHDVDGDGDLDIAVPGIGSENFVYLNDGAGRFQPDLTDGLGQFARLLAMGDLNGDGLIDYVGNGDTGSFGYTRDEVRLSPVTVRLGNQNGGFDTLQTVSGRISQDVVISDLNRDQAPDIVVLSEFGIEVWLQGPPLPSEAPEMSLATIEDPEVRKRIGLNLAKDPDQITVRDLATIRELDLSRLGLTNVTLPTGLTRLETLNLDRNRLESLELPEDATNVRLITVRVSRANGFTLEGRYPSLQRLVVTGESVSEVAFDAEIPELVDLSLWATRVRDFSFLAQIPTLQVLNLGGMELRTATLPSGIPNLKQLSVSRNRLREIVVPRGFSVDQLVGFDRSGFVFYDDAFIGAGQARITGFDRGADALTAITVTAGPGSYEIEFSSALDTWEGIGEFTYTSIETTSHALDIPAGSTGFYRIVRTGP